MATDTTSGPALGTRLPFPCPVCDGGSADATYKLTRYGDPDWLIGCWSIECVGSRTYLADLGEALGIGRDASKELVGVSARSYGATLLSVLAAALCALGRA